MSVQASRAHVALGRAVNHLRVGRRFTQGGLAARSDLQRKTVNQLENARLDPHYSTLASVAGAMDMRLSQMLHVAEELEDRGRGASG